MTLLTKLCAASDCPTVYRTNRGTLIVQGYRVPDGEHRMSLPPGELLVEIPVELVTEAARTMS